MILAINRNTLLRFSIKYWKKYRNRHLQTHIHIQHYRCWTQSAYHWGTALDFNVLADKCCLGLNWFLMKIRWKQCVKVRTLRGCFVCFCISKTFSYTNNHRHHLRKHTLWQSLMITYIFYGISEVMGYTLGITFCFFMRLHLCEKGWQWLMNPQEIVTLLYPQGFLAFFSSLFSFSGLHTPLSSNLF